MWDALQIAWHRWDFVRRIRKHGWTGTYVHGEGVPFTYSIGFWEDINAPEIIMFGMDPDTANGLLHEAHKQLQAGELILADMAPWVLDWEGGPKLVWRAVHPSQVRREFLNVAIWYRERQGLGREGLEAYQLVCTDLGGKFPWEEGYDLNYRPQQEALDLPHVGPWDKD
jgi:hypothetical protein